MKKLLKVIGVIVLLFVLMIGMIVVDLIKNGNKSTINASAEEIEAAVKEMGSGILDGGFYLDGKVYQMPVMTSDLIDGGWIFDEAVTKSFPEIPANTVTNNTNMDNINDNQKLISVTLLNPSDEKKDLEEVYASSISVSKLTANKIILPQGITWKSTVEEVEAAYGVTENKTVDEDCVLLTYDNEDVSIMISFDIDEEGQPKMARITFRLLY